MRILSILLEKVNGNGKIRKNLLEVVYDFSKKS